MSANTRLYLGVTLLVVGLVMPVGVFSLVRYRIGLVLFFGLLAYSWIAAYVPSLQPHSSISLGANLGMDLLLLVSLFILGGDFWDKLRSLFVHSSRAVFPEPGEPATRSAGLGTPFTSHPEATDTTGLDAK